MKIILPSKDELETLLSENARNRLVVDLEAYQHLFDLFIGEFRAFVDERDPGAWSDPDIKMGAAKVSAAFGVSHLINKYYRAWDKQRRKFHVFRDHIYSYDVWDPPYISEVPLRIERLDAQEIAELLNWRSTSVLTRAIQWIRRQFGQ